jgi:DNA-binding FadR family transcriptional regulator
VAETIETDPSHADETRPAECETPVEVSTIRRKRVDDDLKKVRAVIADLRKSDQDRLPPERELADAVGITRSRLRAVLKKLVDEEVIWREVGNGTYFGERPLLSTAGNRNADVADLTNPFEVMEARLLLEPELARLAAFRARGENVAELELCLQKMTESESRTDWMFWDRRFHRAIGRAANSALLAIFLDIVQSNMDRGTWGELSDKLHRHSNLEGSTADHLAILSPIKNRNPAAAYNAMKIHLERVNSIYFGNEPRVAE